MDQEQLAGRRGQYYASSGKRDSGISEAVRRQLKDGDKPEDEDNSS